MPGHTQTAAKISTHTSLAGRDFDRYLENLVQEAISTHTSLAGRDLNVMRSWLGYNISTHTSLAGRDSAEMPRSTGMPFLLTRPSRDVTMTDILTISVT